MRRLKKKKLMMVLEGNDYLWQRLLHPEVWQIDTAPLGGDTTLSIKIMGRPLSRQITYNRIPRDCMSTTLLLILTFPQNNNENDTNQRITLLLTILLDFPFCHV